MGVYFKVINLTKKEFLRISDYESPKFEHFINGTTPKLLTLLLMYNWAGDRIAIVSDEDKPNLLGVKTAFEDWDEKNLYAYVEEDNGYKNITPDILKKAIEFGIIDKE